MPRSKNIDEIEVFTADQRVTAIHEDEREQTASEKKTADFESSLNSTGDEGTISVYRQENGGKSSMTFIMSCPADKYTLDELLNYIQTNHATGEYRIMLRINGRIKGNQLYMIERPDSLNKNLPVQSGNNDVATLAQLVRESMASIRPESETEQLQKMMLYKELFAQPQQPQFNPIEMMTGMMTMMATMKEIMGGGNSDDDKKDDGFGRLIELAGSLAASAMKQPARQAQPVQRSEHVIKNEPTQQQRENKEMFNKLKMGVNYLLNQAKAKTDPAECAEMVVENVAPDTVQQFFASPNALDQLILQFPEIETERQWFDDLGEHVKAIMGDESSRFWNEYTDEPIEDETINAPLDHQHD